MQKRRLFVEHKEIFLPLGGEPLKMQYDALIGCFDKCTELKIEENIKWRHGCHTVGVKLRRTRWVRRQRLLRLQSNCAYCARANNKGIPRWSWEQLILEHLGFLYHLASLGVLCTSRGGLGPEYIGYQKVIRSELLNSVKESLTACTQLEAKTNTDILSAHDSGQVQIINRHGSLWNSLG